MGTAASVLIVAWVFAVAIPKFASYADIWQQLKTVSFVELMLLLGTLLLNVAAYSALWMTCTPGLKFTQSVVMTQSSAAVNNALPAGGPISMGLIWGMLRSWGVTTARIVQATTVSGIANILVKLALPVLAVIFLSFDKVIDWKLTWMAALGLVVLGVAIFVLAMVVRSDRLARRLGHFGEGVASALLRLLRKPPVSGWEERASQIRADAVELVTSRWKQISVAAVASQLGFLLVLLVSLRVMGVNSKDVSFAEVFASFALVRLVTTIPITPGGVGITQLGLVGMLSAVAPASLQPNIAAGVMIYTALTYLITFPLGAACYVVWRAKRGWRYNEDGTPKWQPHDEELDRPGAKALASVN